MRRSLTRRLFITIFAVLVSLPMSAAPGGSSSQPGFFERFIKVVRQIIAMEDVKIVLPVP